jgi:hypothetical protein
MGLPSNPAIHPGTLPNFHPNQVVCLDSEDTHLYAEVVQLIPSRQLCWVRPLILLSYAQWPPLGWPPLDELILDSPLGSGLGAQGMDLRSCSDLLLPGVLFRAAIDTEAIPILSYLYDPERAAHPETELANRQIHQLIHAICKAHPEIFSAIAPHQS